MVRTLPQIAQALGLPDHLVQYAVKRYGPAPIGRAGMARLWDEEAIDEIRRSVEKTRRNRRPAPEDVQ